MRTLFALLFLWSLSAFAQTARDPKFFHKRLGAGDSAVYVPRLNSSLSGYDASGRADLVPRDTFALQTDLEAVDAARIFGDDALHDEVLAEESARIAADALKSDVGHTHTASQVTDFNTAGDARWSLLAHTHVSANITDASDGGNDVADANKLLKFKTTGGIEASTNASGIAVAGSSVDGVGGDFRSTNTWALYAGSTNAEAGWFVAAGAQPAVIINANSTGLALRAVQQGAGADDIASFEGTSGSLIVGTDGGLNGTGTWDATTRTNLSLGNVENTALSTWAGSTNVTTLGTISTGVWGATAIGATRGGTGQTSWTLGDMLYSDATNSVTKLAGNTSGTRMYLSQRGDGAISAAPAWRQIALTELSGFGTGVQTALGVNIGSAGAPVLFNGAGGTPSSLVGTNITGTASGLTAGNVTTNANLTGPVTSVGNATTIAEPELAAIASTTSAADKLPYFTGSGTASTADFSSFSRTVLAQTTQAGYLSAIANTTLATLSGDFTTTSTSFVDVTDVTAAVTTTATYNLEVFGEWSTNNNSGTITVSLDVPAGATVTGYRQASIASNSVSNSGISGADTGNNISAIGTANARCFFMINAKVVTAGTAGNITLRLLSGNAAWTAKVFQGCSIRVTRVQ